MRREPTTKSTGHGKSRSVPEFLQFATPPWYVIPLTLFCYVDLNRKACRTPPRLIPQSSCAASLWISSGSLRPRRTFGPSRANGPIRKSGKNLMMKSLIASCPPPDLAKGGEDHGSISPGMLILTDFRLTSYALHGAIVTGSSRHLMPICHSISSRSSRLLATFYRVAHLTKELPQDFTGQ